MIRWLILFAALLASTPVFAAHNYDMVITNIKPANSGTPAIPSTNRIFRAYPSIEYNIRPAVFGGAYPFTYSLSGQPSGMTINANTGEISWPNPQSNSGTITLTVTDSDAQTATAQWAITVSTSGFYFIDSNAGTNGSGTLASPFNSLANAMASGRAATDIFYFRGGTYDLTANATSDSHPCMEIGWSFMTAKTWIGYPNEIAVIHGNNTTIKTDWGYFDNLSFGASGAGNGFTLGAVIFYGNADYVTFRRNKFVNFTGDTSANLNQGFINNTSEPCDLTPAQCAVTSNNAGYGLSIQDNEFSDYHGGEPIGSLYSRLYTVIEDNYIHNGGDQGSGIVSTSAFGMKRETYYTAIRHNKVIVNSNGLLVTEMYNSYYGTDMEISYNLLAHLDPTKTAMIYFFTPRYYVHHNTIVGNIGNASITNSSCNNYHYSDPPSGFGASYYNPLGPFVFSNNVIVNPNSNFNAGENYNVSDFFGFEHCTASSCKPCITDTNNLKNTNLTTVIDSASVTAGTYTLANRDYVGTYGWELSGSTPSVTLPTTTSTPRIQATGRFILR